MKARSKIDHDTGALYNIPIDHALIHAGHHYVNSAIVRNTNTVNFIVSTAALSSTVEEHCICQIATGSESVITVTRGATWTTTGGLLVPNINRNEMKSTTSELVVYAYPTISGSGSSAILSELIPGGSGPGTFVIGTGSRGSNEFILKPSTVYQVNVALVTTATVGFLIDHYKVIDN